jgi:hypothetical protein
MDFLKANSFLCKVSPLDRFDTVIPHGRFEECAGANGDWIATAGLGGKWELANVYTVRNIPLLAVPFEATDDPNLPGIFWFCC